MNTTITHRSPLNIPLFALRKQASDGPYIDEAKDISTERSEAHPDPVDLNDPGADLRVFVAETEREARSFIAGLNVACAGDDVSYAKRGLADGRFIVIVLDGDSSESQLVVISE